MKNITILSLAVILTLFSACKKERASTADVPVCGPPTIVGKWKLLSSSGGLAGGTIYPAASDTIYYTFNADSTYAELYHSGTTTGTYTSQLVNGHYQLSLSTHSIPNQVDTSNCRMYLSTPSISDGVTGVYGH